MQSHFIDFLAQPNNVDCLSEAFEEYVTKTIDRYAPALEKTRPVRMRQPWYNSSIHEARRIRRKREKKWRKTRLEVHHQEYIEQNKNVSNLIDEAKKLYILEKLECASDSKTVFMIVDGLLNTSSKVLPAYDCAVTLSNSFAVYFQDKVDRIYSDLEKDQCNAVCGTTFNVSVTCKLSEFNQVSGI